MLLGWKCPFSDLKLTRNDHETSCDCLPMLLYTILTESDLSTTPQCLIEWLHQQALTLNLYQADH